MLTITAVIVYFGLDGVQKGFNIAVPVLIGGVLLIAAYVTLNPVESNGVGIIENITNQANSDVDGFTWIQKSAEFVLYNTFACFGVIAALGRFADTSKTIVRGAFGGAVLTCGLALVIVLAIVSNFELVKEDAMPMMSLAKSIAPSLGYVYIFLMFIAILSTAFALMFGIVSRVENYKFYNKKYNVILIIAMSIVALFGAEIGFTQLIGIIYPFYGYVSAVCLVGFLINYYLTFSKKNK